jgi:GLPGLI family protein
MIMQYKKLILSLALAFISQLIFAQHAHFTTSGTIEFDKNVNIYGIMTKQITKDNETFTVPALEAYKKNNPQFKVLKSTLSFSDNKTLFTPIVPENQSNSSFFGGGPMVNQGNTIYTDLSTSSKISQKEVFEEVFLLKDSTRKIKWKITDETREISGYTCRRANAVVMDSIYVVAFYTTEIPVSGGPESFCGLPGMILGVALPHENITWFATKVTDMTLAPNAMVPPKKGKIVDDKAFKARLQSAFKDWGTWSQGFYKGFLL